MWSKRIGDPFIQEGSTAVSASGTVAATGDFYFHIQFDGTPQGQLDDGEREMFVALFDP